MSTSDAVEMAALRQRFPKPPPATAAFQALSIVATNAYLAHLVLHARVVILSLSRSVQRARADPAEHHHRTWRPRSACRKELARRQSRHRRSRNVFSRYVAHVSLPLCGSASGSALDERSRAHVTELRRRARLRSMRYGELNILWPLLDHGRRLDGRSRIDRRPRCAGSARGAVRHAAHRLCGGAQAHDGTIVGPIVACAAEARPRIGGLPRSMSRGQSPGASSTSSSRVRARVALRYSPGSFVACLRAEQGRKAKPERSASDRPLS